MITEDYVSFETAKLLKEKGFDEYCKSVYHVGSVCSVASLGYVVEEKQNSDFGKYDNAISAPTLQMAMKWLREVHTIIIELHHQHRKEWYAIVSSENPLGIGVYTTSTFNTYEEACESAIKYCLENLI